MALETESHPQPTGAPSFEKAVLTLRYKKDRTEIPIGQTKIDLLAMNVVGEIHYYETLFSPATSVMMTIVNPNIRTKIFEDYSILGGERIEFKVNDYLNKGRSEPGLTFTGTVTQVDHYTSNNFAEVFRLRISTVWRFPAGSGITGTISGSPSELAKNIIKGAYSNNKNTLVYENKEEQLNFTADSATNEVKFNIGQERKDNVMAILMRLAAVSQYGSKSAGFFFYRNKYGYQFRAIDNIIESAKKDPRTSEQGEVNFPVGSIYEYEYNGYNPNAAYDPKGAIFSAISFQIQTSDYAEKDQYSLKGGDLFISVDPLKYTNITSSQNYFNQNNSAEFKFLKDNNYKLIEGILPLSESQFNYTRQQILGLTPTEIFNSADTASQVKFYANNPHKDQQVARLRYSSVLDVSCTMTVPLNLNLIAGTMVKVNIGKLKPNQDCNTEEEIVPSEYSGLYIIAAVCHAMDRKKGYSSLHLVRDFGKFE